MTAINKLKPILASDGENAIATKISNWVTQSQLIIIDKICREMNVGIDESSMKLFGVHFNCLSKSGAADLIQYLEDSDHEGKIKKAKILQSNFLI